jgi:NADH-quinone oxidoreductase subunit G
VLAGPPGFVNGLDNTVRGVELTDVTRASTSGLERVTDVPSYFADPLVRRAPSLQKTKDAAVPTAGMNAATFAHLNLVSGAKVKVSDGGTPSLLVARLDPNLPDNCVRVATGHTVTANLGALSGVLTVEAA